MSIMTTTTYRAAAKLGQLDVFIDHHGLHGEVRDVRKVGADRVAVCYFVAVPDGADAYRSFTYPAAHMLEVVIPDPNARIATHIDDIAVGDIVIMMMSDQRFPRPVEVIVEVERITLPIRGDDGAMVQEVVGRLRNSRSLVMTTVSADDGQLDVVGNVADSEVAGA